MPIKMVPRKDSGIAFEGPGVELVDQFDMRVKIHLSSTPSVLWPAIDGRHSAFDAPYALDKNGGWTDGGGAAVARGGEGH